jgi:hypothetical protein
MSKKLVFFFIFAPAHFLLTVLLMHLYWFNYNAGMAGPLDQFCRVLAAVLAVPLLAVFHAAGLTEDSPLWLQLLLLAGYSLLWAALVWLGYSGIRRLLGRRDRAAAG